MRPRHFARYPVPVLSRMFQIGGGIFAPRLRRKVIPVVASGMIVLARAGSVPARRKLSIIVPAYNEAGTLEILMQSLLDRPFGELDVEIILVESNSTDGTREIALKYQHQPRVRLLLEDCPRGKGHAVRAGLAHAKGDFILIQDADLEYDLEDYESLLEPLLQGRESLVLGSRHGEHTWWKMRKFTDHPLLALLFNCGHWFFTTLLNLLFGQRLRDPFTMFKVFRKDCLTGLSFRCNRFDFDIELLVKLLLKGHRAADSGQLPFAVLPAGEEGEHVSRPLDLDCRVGTISREPPRSARRN